MRFFAEDFMRWLPEAGSYGFLGAALIPASFAAKAETFTGTSVTPCAGRNI